MGRSGQTKMDLRARQRSLRARPPLTAPAAPGLPFATVNNASFELVDTKGMKLEATISLDAACPFVSLKKFEFTWEPNGSLLFSTPLAEFAASCSRKLDEDGWLNLDIRRHLIEREQALRFVAWLQEMQSLGDEEFARRTIIHRHSAPKMLAVILEDGRIWFAVMEWGGELRQLGALSADEAAKLLDPPRDGLGFDRPVILGEQIDWPAARSLSAWLEATSG